MDTDYFSASADQKQWATRWSGRLHRSGLGSVAGVLLDILEPLGPLGAQLLLVAQPSLSLITSVSRKDLNGLAQLLDDPAGIAWLRSELVDPAETTASNREDS
jgi:hypothetical protein